LVGPCRFGRRFGPFFFSDRVEPQGPLMLQYTRFRGTGMRWRFSDFWKCCIRTADVEKTMLISNAVEVLAYRPFSEDPIYLSADMRRACDDQRSRQW